MNTITPQLLNTCCVTDPSLQPTLVRAGTGDFYQGHENVRYASPIQVERTNLYGGRLVQSDKTNFAPRIGVVYSPTATWAIRSGFGIFDSQDSGIEYFDMARGWERVNRQGNPNAPNVTYQNFITSTGSYVTLTQPNVYGIVPNLRTPYLLQYILNVQHDLNSNTGIEIGYAGGSGRHLDGLRYLTPRFPEPLVTPPREPRLPTWASSRFSSPRITATTMHLASKLRGASQPA